MTKKYKIDDLNVGDIVYVPVSRMRGFSYLGTLYRQRTVARITPKKTKMVDSKGREYDKRASFYKELDDEMRHESELTSARLNINETADLLAFRLKENRLLTSDMDSIKRINELCIKLKAEIDNLDAKERSNA